MSNQALSQVLVLVEHQLQKSLAVNTNLEPLGEYVIGVNGLIATCTGTDYAKNLVF